MIKAKIIFSAALVIIAAVGFYATAWGVSEGCYNEDACYKDYVKEKDKDVVIAVNRDTNEVELYWSEEQNTWLVPDAQHKKELQKLLDKRVQLREMQARLNQMGQETLYTTNQGSSGRR